MYVFTNTVYLKIKINRGIDVNYMHKRQNNK